MSQPTVSKQMVRRKIREVLNMAAGYGKTEAVLHQAVNDLLGGGVGLQELRDALEWNLGEGFIRSKFDPESEETLWFITRSGIAKQNLYSE